MVTVTNAPEGRTYIHYEWELKDNLSEFQRVFPSFPQDYEQVATPHVIHNGKWIMETPINSNRLVGITRDESETLSYTDKRGVRYTLRVSNKPFGYVIADKDYVDSSDFMSTVRKTLVCARQIHKGELGQTVPIPRVDYVRQPLDPGQKPSVRKARDRRRGNLGWVRLGDLGEAVGTYNPDRQIELVLNYWQFSGHLHYENFQRVGTLVDTVWGSSLDIRLGDIQVVSMTPEEFRREAGLDTSELWIRRGFAYTILRLLALGIRPEVTLPA